MSEPLNTILSHMRELASGGTISSEGFPKLVKIITDDIELWKNSKLEQLEQMVQDWEASMGEDDKTFYSLGIRRAMDVISEEPSLAQLPILEKPDTPNE